MMRTWLVVGSVSGFLSVAAGAFGAHALRRRVPPDLLSVWETGARYQMVHALAIVAVGLLASRSPSGAANAAAWAFVVGTIVFSGSLYALAWTGLRGLGAVTPIGGLAFLAGWALLAVAAFRAAP